MNKTAFVSGASRGIGRAAAKSLAQAGYDLHITCRKSMQQLLEVKKELEMNYGIRCMAYTCNMGNYEEVNRVFESISSLEVLVNNAGVSYIGLLSEMEIAQWQEVMDTNLNSIFYTCKCAIPLMLKKKAGRIINISSVWGNVGASMEVAYSASKGGVNSLTKALAKELAPSHICVNGIACGIIDTKMNQCFDEEEKRALAEEIPADRFGSPEEVAKLIMQLVDAPEYMTGQIITIDGGWY